VYLRSIIAAALLSSFSDDDGMVRIHLPLSRMQGFAVPFVRLYAIMQAEPMVSMLVPWS
jgi:hypothetical protein